MKLALATLAVVDTSTGQSDRAQIISGQVRGTEVGLRTHAVGARFEYLLVLGETNP